MNKRKKVFELAYKLYLGTAVAIVHVESHFHLFASHELPHFPPISLLFRYFRCVYGGLKRAFAAVSKEASASQQTAPVLSCVSSTPGPHSCRGSPSSCINLARIKPQACSKDSGPEVHPGGHTGSRSVSHYCGPIGSSYRRTKRVKSMHHSFDQGPSLGPGFTFSIAD